MSVSAAILQRNISGCIHLSGDPRLIHFLLLAQPNKLEDKTLNLRGPSLAGINRCNAALVWILFRPLGFDWFRILGHDNHPLSILQATWL